MRDLIDRHAAIDLWERYRPYIATKASEYDMELKDLPSAQPTQTNTPNALESLDCVSRQAAIDAIHNADTQIYEGEAAVGRRNYMTKEECCEIIDSLPSAQSEIIRCKDCKHWLHEHLCIELSKYGTIETLPNEYCNRAERRTDGM